MTSSTPADAIIAKLDAAEAWSVLEQALPATRAILSDQNATQGREALCSSLYEAVVRLVGLGTRGKGQVFVLDALAVPMLLAKAGWKSKNTLALSQVRATCERLLERAGNYQTTVALLWSLLLLNGMSVGARPALARYITGLAQRTGVLTGPAWNNDCSIVGRALADHGWFTDRGGAGDTEAISDALQRASASFVSLDAAVCESQVISFLRLTAFDTGLAPIEWLDLVFAAFMVPVATAVSRDRRHFRLVLALEYLFSSSYVRAVEGSERFSALHRIWTPLIERAGAQVRQTLPWPNDGPPRVAFLLHSPQRLAHTDLLLAFLRGLPPRAQRSIDYSVVMLAARGEQTREVETLVAENDVAVHCVDEAHGRELASIMAWLAKHLQEHRVTGLVFVSATAFLVLSAAMRMAPVVAWWSMKYHGIRSPSIDGYLTSPSIFQDRLVIEGHPWRASHAALPPLTKPGADSAGRSQRAALGVPAHAVVLGCFGREAKLLDPRFTDALAAVLHAAPQACFIWAGRSQPAELVARFASLGIAKRCLHVGWVDTKVYAHAIDIYFDSFPFASGHTAYEAMAAGKPIVVLLTPEAMETSTATSIMPLYRGERGPAEVQAEVRRMFTDANGQSLLPFLETEDAYIGFARRLVAEPDFRRAVGSAGKAFVDRFMCDNKKFAETTSRHLLEIIAEKRAAAENRA